MFELFYSVAQAKVTTTGVPVMKPTSNSSGNFDWLASIGLYIFYGVMTFVLVILTIKLIRLCYELWRSRTLVYLKISLPKADSKLDKEKETKKDFKEKIGIMAVFYKSIHKIGRIGFIDTILDWIFVYAKISLELIYKEGQLHFYAAIFPEHVSLFVQQVTSSYPDAEVRIVEQKDYVHIKPDGYTIRAASINKVNESFFPIKTYKYLEDDPLSSLTNNFTNLQRDDVAVFQIVMKPKRSGWNSHAKKVASLVAKGQYKKGLQNGIFGNTWNTLVSPLYWIVNRFVNNEETSSTAPGAQSGDSYKIFNQAEQESQKVLGENAGQPGFDASIRVLVSSRTPESAKA
jgi:hypothetical protein